jgi:alpha-N-arabinofuranosidase
MRFRFFCIAQALLVAVSAFAQTPLTGEIRVTSASEIRRIPATLFGSNTEWVWNGNLLWDPSNDRPDPRYLDLVRTVKPSLLRFPGGTFSDFYDWHNGMGPRANRPMSQAMPGGLVSENNFGTREALEFARQANAKLLITVNAGTGTAQLAADWVRYVNKESNGPRVDYWEIGNELYIQPAQLAPETYAARFIEYANAMKAVDPNIKVGAILNEYLGATTNTEWNNVVLEKAAPYIDFVAVHCAYAPVVGYYDAGDVRTVYTAMLAAPSLIQQSLNSLASRVDNAMPLAKKGQVNIAVTEWGAFYHSDLNSPWYDHIKTLGSGLYTASTLMSFVRTPRTEIANHFKLADPLYSGVIGVRDGQPAPTPSFYAMQLFTQHLGVSLINSTTASPAFDAAKVGFVPATTAVPYLDAVVTLSADRKKCYVTAVNKHFDAPMDVTIDLNSLVPNGSATAWTLAGTGIDANTGTRMPDGFSWTRQIEAWPNPRFYLGSDSEVQLRSAAVAVPSSRFTYRFPAASVTALEIPLK